MKKHILPAILLLIALVLCFSGCKSKAEDYYSEGITALSDGDLETAERKLRKALDNGYDKTEAEEILEIIKYFGDAKRFINNREFEEASEAFDKIPDSYGNYGIADKIEELEDILSKAEESKDAFDSIKEYYENGKFESAISLTDHVDEEYLSSSDASELRKIVTKIESQELSDNRERAASENNSQNSERVQEVTETEAEEESEDESEPASDSSVKYRVRKSSDDAESQIGAFSELENAKKLADANSGYAVYDMNGTAVYRP